MVRVLKPHRVVMCDLSSKPKGGKLKFTYVHVMRNRGDQPIRKPKGPWDHEENNWGIPKSVPKPVTIVTSEEMEHDDIELSSSELARVDPVKWDEFERELLKEF